MPQMIATSPKSKCLSPETERNSKMKIPSIMSPKYPVSLVAGLAGLLTVVNLASAQDWTVTSAPSSPWTSVASSADGIKVVATGGRVNGFGTRFPLPIYTSADSGATWTQTSAPSYIWTSVASSADGSKLVAVAGINNSDRPVYTSTDSGTTWTQTSAPSADWTCVASSADGSKLVAGVGGGPIYTSTDSGATWIRTSAPSSNSWSSVASSADGTRLVAAVANDVSGTYPIYGGPIYTSTDSGSTWTKTVAPSNHWSSVASSADGTKLVATAGGSDDFGSIYTSTDSGATWTQTAAQPNTWTSVASSADGTRLVVGANSARGDGLIYTSTNAGASWMATTLTERWTCVAASSDGSDLVAASDGPIYTLQIPRSPRLRRLSITPSTGSLDISWLVPSTSFVLQENSDLSSTNWTDTPTPPTLNFTNLHYQVTVSPSFVCRFYRLKQR